MSGNHGWQYRARRGNRLDWAIPRRRSWLVLWGLQLTRSLRQGAARRLLPAVRKIKPDYADVDEKQLGGALQHVLWLAMMHLHVGEPKARKIAWIHEQYGSDGWSDTQKDFYNNNVGIRIGKEIEQEIGPDGMRLYLSQGADDTGRWNPSLVNPTIPPNRRFPAVEAQILGLLRAKWRSLCSMERLRS